MQSGGRKSALEGLSKETTFVGEKAGNLTNFVLSVPRRNCWWGGWGTGPSMGSSKSSGGLCAGFGLKKRR